MTRIELRVYMNEQSSCNINFGVSFHFHWFSKAFLKPVFWSSSQMAPWRNTFSIVARKTRISDWKERHWVPNFVIKFAFREGELRTSRAKDGFWIFLRRGCNTKKWVQPRLLCFVFFCRIPWQILESRRLSQREGGAHLMLLCPCKPWWKKKALNLCVAYGDLLESNFQDMTCLMVHVNTSWLRAPDRDTTSIETCHICRETKWCLLKMLRFPFSRIFCIFSFSRIVLLKAKRLISYARGRFLRVFPFNLARVFFSFLVS